jgi:hypothetical protein
MDYRVTSLLPSKLPAHGEVLAQGDVGRWHYPTLISRASLFERVGCSGQSMPDPKSKSMKTTVTSHQFVEAFRACGRESQFSRAALFALFEHFEIIEQYQDEEIEFDPIAICCEFAEYPSAREAAEEYGFEPDDGDDDDSREKSALEWLQNRTQVIEFEGGIVIQNF